MIKQFCLYGFLKNQKYYEPFFLLTLVEMRLNYSTIGLLIGFRALLVNLLEVPSGAFADLWGRKNSMIMSFFAYIAYFLIVGTIAYLRVNATITVSQATLCLFLSIIFFAIGEAFRTGTHKSMIFTWLKQQNRTNEKSQIYGYTRSWSKLGSAFSIILASLFVLYFKNYYIVFFLSAIPYLINLINIKNYPDFISPKGKIPSIKDLFNHLKESLQTIIHNKKIKLMVLESASFEGLFKSSKEYLQPILMAAALPLAKKFFKDLTLNDQQQSVILVGPIYFILYLIAAYFSRKGYKVVHFFKGDLQEASRFAWKNLLIVMLLLGFATLKGITFLAIICFILFYALESLWRPLLVSRFNSLSSEKNSSTLLSVESQGATMGTIILAPLLGFIIELSQTKHWGESPFWSIALLGVTFSLFFIKKLKSQ